MHTAVFFKPSIRCPAALGNQHVQKRSQDLCLKPVSLSELAIFAIGASKNTTSYSSQNKSLHQSNLSPSSTNFISCGLENWWCLFRITLFPCLWRRRINIGKISVIPNLIYRFNVISNKIPSSYFADIDDCILKIMHRSKRPRLASTILKENRVGILTIFDFKTYLTIKL